MGVGEGSRAVVQALVAIGNFQVPSLGATTAEGPIEVDQLGGISEIAAPDNGVIVAVSWVGPTILGGSMTLRPSINGGVGLASASFTSGSSGVAKLGTPAPFVLGDGLGLRISSNTLNPAAQPLNCVLWVSFNRGSLPG